MGSYPPPSGFLIQKSDVPPPEILPPEHRSPGNGDSDAQQAELRAVRDRLPEQQGGQGNGQQRSPRSWAYAPATYLLVATNVAVFIAMLVSGVSFVNPTTDDLLHWGANNAEHVIFYGEWFRVVTAMFVHVGVLHLATNMWCLWNLGLLGEPLIGPVGVFAAYVLSGAAGNLLSVGVSLYFRSDSVGAGASGAVFGIAGVLIVLLKSPRLPIPTKELSGLRRYVIYFAAINFVIGFGSLAVRSVVRIDNMAHLGGFLGGILFALPMVPLLGSPRKLFFFRRRIAVGVMTAVLVFFGYFLSTVFWSPS